MKKQQISPELKNWLDKTSKKYAKALKVLAEESPEELIKYDIQVNELSDWFRQFYKEDRKLLNKLSEK